MTGLQKFYVIATKMQKSGPSEKVRFPDTPVSDLKIRSGIRYQLQPWSGSGCHARECMGQKRHHVR